MFYPPEGFCESRPQGVRLKNLSILMGQEMVLGVSKTGAVRGLFEILKMFYLMGLGGVGCLQVDGWMDGWTGFNALYTLW